MIKPGSPCLRGANVINCRFHYFCSGKKHVISLASLQTSFTHYCLIKCRKTLIASWLFASLTWEPPASESCCNLWLSLMQEHTGCCQPCRFLVWLGKSTWCARDGRCITSLLIWSQSEWAYCGWRVVAPSYTHVSGDLLCLLVNSNVTM
jgi:hypothetical protein